MTGAVVGVARAFGARVQRSHLVAIIAASAQSRAEVSAYLGDAGFAVRAARSVRSIPDDADSVVWICEAHHHLRPLVAVLVTWLASPPRRALVVTCRPTSFQDAIQAHGSRLAVFPPGTFAWQLVDALRTVLRSPPREASK